MTLVCLLKTSRRLCKKSLKQELKRELSMVKPIVIYLLLLLMSRELVLGWITSNNMGHPSLMVLFKGRLSWLH